MSNGPMDTLLAIMARLRDPETGCPWDVEQDFGTIAPYTIEEAYEVADAIARQDMAALKEELGDLLLQVVFHARLAEEAGAFDFSDVARGIGEKMVARHPHVFGDAHQRDAQSQTVAWEAQKARERADKAAARGVARHSVLDDVALPLPALMRAEKLTKRAARVGFDWPDLEGVFDKLDEELAELRTELAAASPARDRLEDEIGDMLFVLANLARKLRLDPEVALRRANDKFVRRFRYIEDRLAVGGRSPAQSDLAEMDALWNDAKRQER